MSNGRKFKQIDKFTWDNKNDAINFSSCGEDFKQIFESSGITSQDVNDHSTSLVVLDALIKFKKIKDSSKTLSQKQTKLNKEKSKKRQFKETIIKETISKQLGRRFRALVKNKQEES